MSKKKTQAEPTVPEATANDNLQTAKETAAPEETTVTTETPDTETPATETTSAETETDDKPKGDFVCPACKHTVSTILGTPFTRGEETLQCVMCTKSSTSAMSRYPNANTNCHHFYHHQ